MFSKYFCTLGLKNNHSLINSATPKKQKLDEYGKAAVRSEIRTNKLKQSGSEVMGLARIHEKELSKILQNKSHFLEILFNK